jgi:hypothetical protein
MAKQAAGFWIVFQIGDGKQEVSDQAYPKAEAIRKAKDLLKDFQYPRFARADVVNAKGVMIERFSAGWPDNKIKHIDVYGPVKYDLDKLKTGSWRVALGRRGQEGKFLTEQTWPTKQAAKQAANDYLENNRGLWDSAVVVDPAEVVAIRAANKR